MPDTDSATKPTPPRRRGAPKVAVFVAQQIINEITTNGYEVGHRLPPEQVMLQEYGVARGTLREALRILEHHGVVRVRSGPQGGPVVRDPGASDLANTLALLMQIKKVPVRSVMELRLIMEPALTALAAQRATPEAKADLAANIQLMSERINDEETFVASNLAFHERIARASRNVLFAMIVEALDHILDKKLDMNFSKRTRQSILASHARINKAVQVGDAEAARDAMAAHLADTQAYFSSRRSAILDAGILWGEAHGW